MRRQPGPALAHFLSPTHTPQSACLCMDGGWIHNAQSVGNTPTTLPFIHTSASTIHGKAAAMRKFALQCPTPLFGKTTTHYSILLRLYLQVVSLSFHICPVFSHTLTSLPKTQPPINIFVGSYGDTWPFFFYPFPSSLLAYCHYFLIPFAVLPASFLCFLRIHWKWRVKKQ